MAGLKQNAVAAVGICLERLFPSVVRQIETGERRDSAARLKRAIVKGRIMRARARGGSDLQDALGSFWRESGGDAYHIHDSDDVFALFRNRHRFLLADVAGAAAAEGLSFTRLVEVGCGTGLLLRNCMEHLGGIDRVVGIDLNAVAVATARDRVAMDPRAGIVRGEAATWLAAHPAPGTILLSYNGVLEYMAPETVSALYRDLARSAPAAIALCEPVAHDHDLATNPDSYPFGAEQSFSHNHRARLESAGDRIVTAREDFHEPSRTRLSLVVALAPAAAA